ncbi:MAG: tetratricopeptide repeat protein [Candidatus Kapabacteria bacterium]|nr:tetratricopeptide repeat protein [Candidatus Kapabacteria bacterium]
MPWTDLSGSMRCSHCRSSERPRYRNSRYGLSLGIRPWRGRSLIAANVAALQISRHLCLVDRHHIDVSMTRSRPKPATNNFFDRVAKTSTALTIVAVAAMLVYGQVLWFELGKLDENTVVTFNYDILKDPSKAIDVLSRDAFFQRPGRDFYRPVQNATLFIDTQIGGGDGWVYYLSNLLLHAAASCLLLLTLKDLGCSTGVSLATTIAFTVSPLFAQAVAWVPGRGDLLIGLLTLLCLRTGFKFLDTGRIGFLAAFHGFFLLAVFSKETSVLIPVMILMAWLLVHPQRAATRKNLVFLLAPTPVSIALFFYLRSLVIPRFPEPSVFGLEPFVHNLRVIPESIGKFFVPVGLAPMPAFSWLVTVIGIVVMVGLGLLAYRGVDKHGRKLALLGFGWFLLFTIPGIAYTNELGSISYDYLEHRSYLPLMGIMLVLAVIFMRMFRGAHAQRSSMAVLSLLGAAGITALIHAGDYKTPASFYDLAIDSNPASGMALLNRGFLRMTSGDPSGAISDYSRSAEVCPTYAEPLVNRGVMYQESQQMDLAGSDFREATRRNPNLFAAQYNLAEWYAKVDDLPNALQHYKHSARLDPKHGEAWTWIASIIAKSGDVQGALPYFDTAISVAPNLAIIYTNRGKAFSNVGRMQEACADWTRGSSLGSAECSNLVSSFCR